MRFPTVDSLLALRLFALQLSAFQLLAFRLLGFSPRGLQWLQGRKAREAREARGSRKSRKSRKTPSCSKVLMVSKALSVLLALLPAAARAQLPLTIEQLLVPQQRVQGFASLDYRAESPLPGLERRGSRLSTGLRYGLHRRWEVNASLGRSSLARYLGTQVERSDSQSLTLGSSWLLRDESRYPAVLLGLRATHDFANGSGRGGRQAALSATFYQSIDPVVLSLNVVLGRAWEDNVDGAQTATYWTLSPEVNFAVNPRVTLLWGLNFSRQEDRRDLRGAAQETVALRAGLGFAFGPGDTVFLLGNGAGAQAPARLTLQWFHQF